MRLARGARRLVALAAVVLLSAACGLTELDQLNFRVDHRLRFVSPKDRSDQHLPLTIQWRMKDFTVAAPGSAPPNRSAGYFVVFVDQPPVQPGKTLVEICKADPFVRGDRNCPTPQYLQGKRIYVTTADHVTVPNLANLAGNKDAKQLHTFVVVLMDTAGRRIGESAWELDIRLPRIGG